MITSFAGCIRGAIAFGLAMSLSNGYKNDDKITMLTSSTLILVFFTTILFGAFMSSIVKFFSSKKRNSRKSLNEEDLDIELSKYSLQGFDGETLTIGDFENFLNKPYYSTNKIEGLWNKIDDWWS